MKQPGVSVVFSELMKRDDGVLRSLLQAEGLSEVEIAGEIDRFVFEVRHHTERAKRYEMRGVGVFMAGPNATIRFHYDPTVKMDEVVVQRPKHAPKPTAEPASQTIEQPIEQVADATAEEQVQNESSEEQVQNATTEEQSQKPIAEEQTQKTTAEEQMQKPTAEETEDSAPKQTRSRLDALYEEDAQESSVNEATQVPMTEVAESDESSKPEAQEMTPMNEAKEAVATDKEETSAAEETVDEEDTPSRIRRKQMAQRVAEAFADESVYVSQSAKRNPEPFVKGLRYRRPHKSTDACSYVDRPQKKGGVDRFLIIALVAALLAVGAILFGYFVNEQRVALFSEEEVATTTTQYEVSTMEDAPQMEQMTQE